MAANYARVYITLPNHRNSCFMQGLIISLCNNQKWRTALRSLIVDNNTPILISELKQAVGNMELGLAVNIDPIAIEVNRLLGRHVLDQGGVITDAWQLVMEQLSLIGFRYSEREYVYANKCTRRHYSRRIFSPVDKMRNSWLTVRTHNGFLDGLNSSILNTRRSRCGLAKCTKLGRSGNYFIGSLPPLLFLRVQQPGMDERYGIPLKFSVAEDWFYFKRDSYQDRNYKLSVIGCIIPAPPGLTLDHAICYIFRTIQGGIAEFRVMNNAHLGRIQSHNFNNNPNFSAEHIFCAVYSLET